MYHIPEDLRAKKSAAKIEEAVYELLKDREMNEVSVIDISHVTGTSRATFYRLFDVPVDVMRWAMDRTMKEMAQMQRKREADGEGIDLLRNMQYMLSDDHYRTVKALVECHRTDIIQESLTRYMTPYIESVLHSEEGKPMTKTQMAYSLNMMVGMITAELSTWIERGQKEDWQGLSSQLMTFQQLLTRISANMKCKLKG